ncbi:MAG: class I SAM-dependent methyltransferase [Cyanobacteria bacterium K_DeepCast_35m_m2_155]|nr:class I SAM-dependent methyltransferase [Cyanobacteria bacterium K_DeepCast_35m_m2_155]
MKRPLRTLAYRHRWFYDAVSAISALSVGGPERLRQLAPAMLASRLPVGAPVLDLCCGGGEGAIALARLGLRVCGLDVAPRALDQARERARRCGLTVQWIEGLAEDPPLAPCSQAGITIALALHEFSAAERRAVLAACTRLLQPGGWLALVDLHPARGVMALPQQLFCALFETETAIDFLASDLSVELEQAGLAVVQRERLAGGALQRLLAQKPPLAEPHPPE